MSILNFFSMDIMANFISTIQLIVSTILTIVVIWQTFKISKKTISVEKDLQSIQVQMQQRQLRLDLYPYKQKVFKSIFEIVAICDDMSRYFERGILDGKTPEQINSFREI